MNTILKKIKNKIKKNQTIYGTWSHIPNPQIVEIIGSCGLDFIVFDMEHGPHSFSQLSNLYLAAESKNMLPITRVSGIENSNILRCLDNGSKGIIVPHVDSFEKAKKSINLMRYGFHHNSRGVSTLSRASIFDIENEKSYLKKQNENILSCLIIEDVGGLDEIDKILKIKNLDIIFLGIYDLSQSLNIPSKKFDIEMNKILKIIIKKAKKNNIAVGTYAPNPKKALILSKLGVNFITINVDGSVLKTAYSEIIRNLK